jgi:regulatory protein
MIDQQQLFRQLYKSSLRYLGIRLRSEHEVRTKLRQWLTKQESLDFEERKLLEDKVVGQLFKDRFLDDARFSEEWISSRLRSKPRGEMLIRMELTQKGISKELISKSFDVLHSLDEGGADALYASAVRLGTKYMKKYAHLELREARYKLSGALARKGFDGSLIKRVVDELLARG